MKKAQPRHTCPDCGSHAPHHLFHEKACPVRKRAVARHIARTVDFDPFRVEEKLRDINSDVVGFLRMPPICPCCKEKGIKSEPAIWYLMDIWLDEYGRDLKYEFAIFYPNLNEWDGGPNFVHYVSDMDRAIENGTMFPIIASLDSMEFEYN